VPTSLTQIESQSKLQQYESSAQISCTQVPGLSQKLVKGVFEGPGVQSEWGQLPAQVPLPQTVCTSPTHCESQLTLQQ